MRYRLPAAALFLTALVAVPVAQAPEKLDYAAIAQIRDEGLNRSQVMNHISWLSDVYGPRLTGSPAILQASDWAMKKLTDWGLANVHRETWAFGKGWSLVRFSAQMVEPQVQPLIGFPGSWTPGTKGAVTAEVVRVQIDSEADFDKYRGKLAGRIVLTQPERAVTMLEGTIVHRMEGKDLEEALTTPIPAARGGGRGRGRGAAPTDDTAAGRGGAQSLRARIAEFYKAEGVVATFDRGGDSVMASVGSELTAQQQHTDGGTIFPTGNLSRGADAGTGVPSVTLAVEHYNRMVRILAKNIPVKVELNIETKFYDETTPNGFNTIAEIPGTDPVLKDEVVLLGAHFDSVAAATGATDNATGSAAMMEAMRILKAVGVKPRRTIRIGLWGGEEEGLLGSRAYVLAHYGDPATMALKPEHAKLAAYFNSDNGTGRVRGVWLQGNLAVKPIFEQWIAPLRDLGVVALGPRAVTSTDHVSFDNVGLPGFQFMVDRLEYNSRTHHSNMDFYDRVQRDDMVQQATVVAVFAYNAAMRDEKLPRKALPKPQPQRGRSE
jgi:carboxypeptidase Q